MKGKLLAFSVLFMASLVLTRLPGALGQQVEKDRVRLKVLMPQAEAILTIEGKATAQTGTVRTFKSPPLDPANKYSYTLKVVWEPNNYTKITRKHVVKDLQ